VIIMAIVAKIGFRTYEFENRNDLNKARSLWMGRICSSEWIGTWYLLSWLPRYRYCWSWWYDSF